MVLLLTLAGVFLELLLRKQIKLCVGIGFHHWPQFDFLLGSGEHPSLTNTESHCSLVSAAMELAKERYQFNFHISLLVAFLCSVPHPASILNKWKCMEYVSASNTG